MINFLSSRRFLAAYSSSLTIIFALSIVYGFARVEPKGNFDELTVHRINVVEPDGTIRLVLTNTANSPGIYIKNKEYPTPTTENPPAYSSSTRKEPKTAASVTASPKTKAARSPAVTAT
jgi:hypothetical protein